MNWCPECNRTQEGTVCESCGGELRPLPEAEWGRREAAGSLLERWPKGADGQPERPVFLCHRSCVDMDDKLTVGKLRAYGIPVLTQLPGDGQFGELVLGMAGLGVDLFVPESLGEDARELIKEETEDGQ